jgi:hypothetical protein
MAQGPSAGESANSHSPAKVPGPDRPLLCQKSPKTSRCDGPTAPSKDTTTRQTVLEEKENKQEGKAVVKLPTSVATSSKGVHKRAKHEPGDIKMQKDASKDVQSHKPEDAISSLQEPEDIFSSGIAPKAVVKLPHFSDGAKREKKVVVKRSGCPQPTKTVFGISGSGIIQEASFDPGKYRRPNADKAGGRGFHSMTSLQANRAGRSQRHIRPSTKNVNITLPVSNSRTPPKGRLSSIKQPPSMETCVRPVWSQAEELIVKLWDLPPNATAKDIWLNLVDLGVGRNLHLIEIFEKVPEKSPKARVIFK